jgi:hypothetical protein
MSFASPSRVSRHAGASLEATWNSTCNDLGYSSELRTAGWELLQRLDSKQDKLGDQSAQVRVIAQQLGSCSGPAVGSAKRTPTAPRAVRPLRLRHARQFFFSASTNCAALAARRRRRRCQADPCTVPSVGRTATSLPGHCSLASHHVGSVSAVPCAARSSVSRARWWLPHTWQAATARSARASR